MFGEHNKLTLIYKEKIMRKVILLMLIVLVLCGPTVGSAYAAQIEAKEFSSSEAQELSVAEANSITTMESIIGGEEDALLIAFAVIGILVLIAAAAAS